MGVLHVNVGDAVTPDWRNIGCGDPGVSDFADRSATCASTMNGPLKYVGTWAGGQVPIPPQPLIPADGHGAWRYVVVPSGTATSSVCSLSVGAMSYHDADGSYGYWSGTTTMPAGSDVYVFAHDDLSGFPPVPSPGAGDTSNPNVYAATAGRLKLWDGTRWMREVCDGDSPAGIVDNANRTDGTSVVANRSDGGLWTLPSGSLWAILSNRLVKQVNSAGKITADHGAYSNSITIEVLCNWPDPYARCQAGILGSDADGTGGASIEGSPFEGYFRVLGPGFGANLLGVVPEDGAEHTLTLTVDLTTGDFVGKFDGVTQQTGTFTSIPTGTIATLETYNWVMSNASTGVLNGFDNVSVTGTGGPERHPLKMWDGTTWQTVACMTPA